MTWERSTFRGLGEWFGGGTPSKANAAYWLEGEIPWLSPKDMGPMVLADTQDHITPAAVVGSSVREVPAGSVAVVVRSGILERTLPVALVPFTTTLNQDMKAVVPRSGVDPRWIAWGLRAYERDLLRDTRKAGTTVASIEMPRFYQSTLPVPELAEQWQIVDILEDHLSRLDAADRELRGAAARLSTLRRALREVALAPEPRWPTLSVLELTSGERSDVVIGPFGSNLTTADYTTSGVPLIFVRNVRSADFDSVAKFVSAAKAAELSAHQAIDGDVLMTKMGNPPGDTAVYRGQPSVITADVLRLRPSAQHYPEFIALALGGDATRGQVLSITSGVAQKKISLARFRSTIAIALPNRDEQERRFGAFAERLNDLARLEASVGGARVRAQGLRRAVLGAAFKGNLTGRHTDDEVIEATAAGDR